MKIEEEFILHEQVCKLAKMHFIESAKEEKRFLQNIVYQLGNISTVKLCYRYHEAVFYKNQPFWFGQVGQVLFTSSELG